MALVKVLFERPQERVGVHPTTVECGYTVVDTPQGPILQLTTFGSESRQMPGKASQTIQFDVESATALARIIAVVFSGREVGSGR